MNEARRLELVKDRRNWDDKRTRNCKIGTVPYLVWVHGRDKIEVGKVVRVRWYERQKWVSVKIDRINDNGYFFASL